MEYYKAWFDNGLYIIEDLALKIIMQCRLSSEETEKFRSELLFKQHNIIMTKVQSVLKSIKDAFEGEDMQTQYNVLGYKIDLHFYDYKLAIEVDEKSDKDRDIHHETERQKATEKNSIVNLLELILIKKTLIFLRPYTKYIDIWELSGKK